MNLLFQKLKENRRIHFWSLATIIPLTIVFAVTLGAGQGYHKIYQNVGGSDILAVSEGNVACPYISLVPEHYRERLLEISHVVAAASEVRQRYAYGKNQNLTLTAMDPDKLLVFKDLELEDKVLADFKATANGALVGRKIANFFDWEPGQEVRVSGLVFKVAGIFEQPLSVYESMVILHKEYLQQITAKQGYATSMLVKTDLGEGEERDALIQKIEAVFADHPSTIVCRPENELWLAIKASQGNLGDIIDVLGVALGILLVVLHINNGLFAFKRTQPTRTRLAADTPTGWASLEMAAVSIGGGLLAVLIGWLGTLNHPYVGTDMFHPPIYVNGTVVAITCLVSLLAGALAAFAVLIAGIKKSRSQGVKERNTARIKFYIAATLCLGVMTVVFAGAQTLGTTLKSKIMRQGTAGNMIVVDAGADTPMFSSLPPETYDFLRTVPHVARFDGEPMVSRCLELAGLVYDHFTVVKGVDPIYYQMIDQARMIAGRLPAAENEIIVGSLLADKVRKEIAVGDRITFEGEQWAVVGMFEDPLTVMGSGIVARLEDVKRATNRDHLSFVTLRAEDDGKMDAIAAYIRKTYDALLMENPDVPGVAVASEAEYYLHESEAINPLVLFFQLINALYLLVGALVLYNIVDSMSGSGSGDIQFRTDCEGCGRSHMITNGLRILVMGVAGGLLALAATPLIAKVSINFMMMTFYLQVPFAQVAIGTVVAILLGLLAAFLAVRKKMSSIMPELQATHA
jgi:hypothetical protein